MGRIGRGMQLWTLPIAQAAQWLAETAQRDDPGHVTALAGVFTARVMLDISQSQEQTAKASVEATHTLVIATQRLVKATLAVAVVTAIAAVAAVATAVIG